MVVQSWRITIQKDQSITFLCCCACTCDTCFFFIHIIRLWHQDCDFILPFFLSFNFGLSERSVAARESVCTICSDAFFGVLNRAVSTAVSLAFVPLLTCRLSLVFQRYSALITVPPPSSRHAVMQTQESEQKAIITGKKFGWSKRFFNYDARDWLQGNLVLTVGCCSHTDESHTAA